jgi:hypothetical protein
LGLNYLSRFYAANGNHLPSVTKKSYDRFLSEARESADLGLSLLEGRKSVETIVETASLFYKTWLDIKRLRFKRAFRRIGVTLSPKDRGQTAANLWLKYHYGWVPMVIDIGNAVSVLQSRFPGGKVRGSATYKGRSSKTHTAGNKYTGWEIFDERLTVLRVANVSVSNPNLYLANSLGFINPLSVIWELVPFSFVIDWFFPVGDFLRSYTDLLGLDIKNPTTTYFYSLKGGKYYYYGYPYFDRNLFGIKGRSFRVKRLTTLDPPFAHSWPIGSLNVSRAANAVALMRTVFNTDVSIKRYL